MLKVFKLGFLLSLFAFAESIREEIFDFAKRGLFLMHQHDSILSKRHIFWHCAIILSCNLLLYFIKQNVYTLYCLQLKFELKTAFSG